MLNLLFLGLLLHLCGGAGLPLPGHDEERLLKSGGGQPSEQKVYLLLPRDFLPIHVRCALNIWYFLFAAFIAERQFGRDDDQGESIQTRRRCMTWRRCP